MRGTERLTSPVNRGCSGRTASAWWWCRTGRKVVVAIALEAAAELPAQLRAQEPTKLGASVARLGAARIRISGSGVAGAESFVGLAGAESLPDGGIVVGDRQLVQVVLFDSIGRFARTIGRKGRGPGEYREVDAIHLRGDTIVVIDGRTAAHLYLPSGSWLLSRRLPTVGGYLTNPAIGYMGGDRFLLRMRPVAPPPRPNVVLEDSIELWTWDGTKAPQPLKTIPVGRDHRHSSSKGAAYPTLFSPSTSYALAGEYRVRCLDGSGRSQDVVVEQRVGAKVTAREVAAARRVRAGYSASGHNKYTEPSLREHRERVAQQAAAEPIHPVMGEILSAADGAIWVRQYTPAIGMADQAGRFVDEPSTWVEYGTDGKRRRAFRVPARHWVTAIDDRRIVAIVRDEDDVEDVRVYDLPR
jgi:hypothetical protein